MAEEETKAPPCEDDAPAPAAPAAEEEAAAPAEELPSPEADAAAVAAVIDESGAGSAYLSDVSSVHGMTRWVRRRIVLRGLGVGKCLEAGSDLWTEKLDATAADFLLHDDATCLCAWLEAATLEDDPAAEHGEDYDAFAAAKPV